VQSTLQAELSPLYAQARDKPDARAFIDDISWPGFDASMLATAVKLILDTPCIAEAISSESYRLTYSRLALAGKIPGVNHTTDYAAQLQVKRDMQQFVGGLENQFDMLAELGKTGELGNMANEQLREKIGVIRDTPVSFQAAAPPSGWLTAANMCFMAAVSLHVATAAKNANLNGNSGNQGVLVGGSKPAGGLRFNANIGNFRFQVEKVVKIT